MVNGAPWIWRDEVTEKELQALQARMRTFFAAREPLTIPLDRERLSLVAYVDTRPPRRASRAQCRGYWRYQRLLSALYTRCGYQVLPTLPL